MGFQENNLKIKKSTVLFREIYKKYGKKHILLMLLLLILNFSLAGISSTTAYLIGPAINKIFMQKDISVLALFAGVVFGLFFAKALLMYIYALLSTILSYRITNSIRLSIFRKTLSMSLKNIEKLGKGKFLSLLGDDVSNTKMAMMVIIIDIIKEATSAIGLIVVVIRTNWRLSLISLLMYFFFIIPFSKIIRILREKNFIVQQNGQCYNDKLFDVQNGFKTIKTYNSEITETRFFWKLVSKLTKLDFSALKYSALCSPLNEFVSGLIAGTMIFIGGYQTIKGITDIGSFISFLTAFMMLQRPVRGLLTISNNVQRGFASMQRILDFLEEAESEKFFIGKKPDLTNAEIKIKNLNFTYSDDDIENVDEQNCVLKNISLTIKPKSKIAFVGLSGSGKSTITSLLIKLYSVKNGQILFDGNDINDISTAYLRKNIAYVGQENFLFDDTVRNNVVYNNVRDEKEQTLLDTLDMAQINFLENMGNGVESLVGSNGGNLSGGQKQRISIARAIWKDSPIVVFDEATSALDANTEAGIRDMIFERLKDRTVILIAHRLTTITQCDCIYMMQNGEIVEQGTHEELLSKKGLYYKMWENFQNDTTR